ncbi:MAG: hypothetical protein R3E89_13205 [Thiolinea sp.]
MNIGTRDFWVNGRGDKRQLHEIVDAKINTAASRGQPPVNRSNIRFYPDGSSTGGSVELTARGQTFRSTVEWISGRVSIPLAAVPEYRRATR